VGVIKEDKYSSKINFVLQPFFLFSKIYLGFPLSMIILKKKAQGINSQGAFLIV
jgi:hypothetical protein